MTEKRVQVCPACGVKIIGDQVHFSFGAPGTRERLWARVCQFAKKGGCINQNKDALNPIQPDDYYGDVDDLPLPNFPKKEKVKPTPELEPLPGVVAGMLKKL
ncbi:MAG: hypothetical protein ACOC0N_00780 [Chroococcales cyanobacterium]